MNESRKGFGGWGTFLVVSALVIAITTWSLGPAACGGNREPCEATSSPVLAIALAWIGVVGVVIALLLARRGRSGAKTVVIPVTVAIYVAWLALFVDVYVISDEREYRSRTSAGHIGLR